MTDVFESSWKEFLHEVRDGRQRLVAELRLLHQELNAATSELAQRYDALGEPQLEPGRLDSLAVLFGDHAGGLLRTPLDRIRKQRLQDRLPHAFDRYRSELADAVRGVPARAQIRAADLIAALGEGSSVPFGLRVRGWSSAGREIRARALAADGLEAERWLMARAQGAVYLLFARGLLLLLDPWQSARAVMLRSLRNEDPGMEELSLARAKWKDQIRRLERHAEGVLGALETRGAGFEQRVTGRVLRGPSSGPARRRRSKRLDAAEEYWARQVRAVRSLVETELHLASLGSRAVTLAGDTFDHVEGERKAVLEELNAAIDGLRQWRTGQDDPVPPARAQLTSSRERMRFWSARFSREARSEMPGEVESLEPRRRLPGLWAPWKTLEPEDEFLGAIEAAIEPAEAALQDIEADHKSLLAEIERAREVVRFSIQSSADDLSSADALVEESVGNAATLLEHERDTLVERLGAVESGIIVSTATAFYQFHVAFEQGRIDLWSYLAREGLARGLRRLAHGIVTAGVRSLRWVWSKLHSTYHRALVAIGWEAPLKSGFAPVEQWNRWDARTGGDLGAVDLPRIYERLFRAEPVEDPRFLVGREPELEALSEARDAWKAGNYSAVLISGERGSGKTSLLNCALSRSFAGDVVVRGSFHDRILTAEALRQFLAELIGVPPGDLMTALASAKRVIVLEETARTHLRVVGGSQAISELLGIISAANDTTLWILTMAADAFRLLDRSVGMARHFSHRINASSVEPDQLREAILQRHSLSGLRLRFAEPPSTSRFQAWLRARTRIAESPETALFNTLYRQSGGIYRSAFQLWQRYIERPEGGVLYMSHASNGDYAAIIRELTREDIFTLRAIMQHGSLTLDEHARVFSQPPAHSRANIEHLLGRGILEPEPGAPGYRVRPSAGMLVRSALNAENLI